MKEEKSILKKSYDAALAGGIPGMAAMGIQVTSLMWLRTTMNYQYKYGTTMAKSMKILYNQGGISRFYSGYGFALLQGPLSRFGDTAANTGMLAYMDMNDSTKNLPIAAKTMAASLAAASFRILLMPIDTTKTMLQVEGANGFKMIKNKILLKGPSSLFHGSIASALATFAGHYPWYTTYNYLQYLIPEYNEKISSKLIRSAFIGFCASLASDTISNSFRVIKTAKQTSSLEYSQVIKEILLKDGPIGLFGRGLKTRILTNCIQGIMFSVLWRLGQDYYKEQLKKKAN